MARIDTLGNFLTDVATAIREKKGTTDTILASNFDTEIASIESGVDINEYLSDTITKGTSSSGGWLKTIIKLRSPLTVEGNSAEYMFYGCLLNELPQLDTSNVKDMTSMFEGCKNLTTIPQIDTSNVTRMNQMFYHCSNLTTIPQIDTSKVNSMTYMFGYCSNLTTIPQIDTSSLSNMAYMFYNCTNLTTIPQLNGENMGILSEAFYGCKSLENFNGIINLGQAYQTSQSANYNYYKLVLTSSTLLTEQSIINILNNLYDIKTKGCNAQQVVLGSTNLAKLTSEEGQTALTNAAAKGWTIS